MVAYTIEELHELFKSGELSIKEYYEELFKEVEIQQKRLNAFVTITKDEAMKNLESIEFNNLLDGIPFILKDNYNTNI